MNWPNLLALFNVSFPRFVTVDVIKGIYALMVFTLAAATLIVDLSVLWHIIQDTSFDGSWMHSPGHRPMIIGASPFAFLLVVLLCRIWCECVLVVFRIASELAEIRRKLGGHEVHEHE